MILIMFQKTIKHGRNLLEVLFGVILELITILFGVLSRSILDQRLFLSLTLIFCWFIH
jgi:hypothetical protein